MKERPILFSAPMVRAILAGQKTQTRRVMKKLPPQKFGCSHSIKDCIFGKGWSFNDARGNCACDGVRCPYGEPGDRLWVRETWAHAIGGGFHYKADYGHSDWLWKPSIHMPRRASRITLEVAGVRVERLQDISEADAYAEGVEATEYGQFPAPSAFKYLWESINGPESWISNPWVWVVEFKKNQP